jgi:FAD/FMN-containing dehydrogenase
MTRLLFDYGKLHAAALDGPVLTPDSLADAQAQVRAALDAGQTLRVRGSGHSQSGISLPRSGETLLRTGGLDHYRFDRPGTITVGAGSILWDIRDFVAPLGWYLPVYNGGWAGPTVGGYVNAGGMGLRVPPTERARAMAAQAQQPTADRIDLVSISEVHGGFWEHVAELTVIDSTGTLQRIGEDHPDFPWFFAATGQLGVIVEAVLKLLPNGPITAPLPAGNLGRIPKINTVPPEETDAGPPPDGMPWMYWFSYLLDPKDEALAWDFLGDWARHHPSLTPSGGFVGPSLNGAPIGFRYLVRHKRFTPPLLYPAHRDFVLMGVMARCEGVGQDIAETALIAAEQDFVATALQEGWRLYAQAENLTRSVDFANYYGPDCMAAFRAVKDRYDPESRFNPGEVFAEPVKPPPRAATLRRVARAFARALQT